MEIAGGAAVLAYVGGKLVQHVAEIYKIEREPALIVKRAQAESDAESIRATGEIERQNRVARMQSRVLAEEMLNQENIEAVLTEAENYLNEDAEPSHVKNSWYRSVVDRAKLISEAEARSMLAKLIAGETNAPGTFSLKAVDALTTMDAADARQFKLLMGTAIDANRPVIFDLNHAAVKSAGIDFERLLELEHLGLIRFEAISDFAVFHSHDQVNIRYFEHQLNLTSEEWKQEGNDSNRLTIGRVTLTATGKQLAGIIEPVEIPGYVDYLISEWESRGVIARSAPH